MSHAYYLNCLFDANIREGALERAAGELYGKRYDGFLVSSGVSGMFGAILAHRMQKKLVVARKANVSTHSSYKAENLEEGDRLIFIDYIIDSGSTLEDCLRTVRSRKREFKFVGAYFYDSNKYMTASDLKSRYHIK